MPQNCCNPHAVSRAARKKILFVDPHVVTRESRPLLLSESGYAVDWARSVAEARSRWTPDAYNLVLIDVNDDAYTGVLLCQEMKERHPQQVVGFITEDGFRLPPRFVPNGLISRSESPGNFLTAVKVLLAEL